MAQGGLKRRLDKFSVASSKGKSTSQKKSRSLGPRKGGHYIAPKKAKLIQAQKKNKEYTKQIGLQLEKEIHQQAVSKGNEFRILQNTPSTSSAPETSAKKSSLKQTSSSNH